jgi:DNA-binding response OmpR family regulator
MKLLIVEDEPDIALIIEDAALSKGFDVIAIATNAREAMEVAPEADIAIVDVILSDGATGPAIAHVLVTGFGVGVAYLTGNPELVENMQGLHIVSKPPTETNIGEALVAAAKWRSENLRKSA